MSSGRLFLLKDVTKVFFCVVPPSIYTKKYYWELTFFVCNIHFYLRKSAILLHYCLGEALISRFFQPFSSGEKLMAAILKSMFTKVK